VIISADKTSNDILRSSRNDLRGNKARDYDSIIFGKLMLEMSLELWFLYLIESKEKNWKCDSDYLF